MAAKDFRICPACGGRNKAKWEFCIRCGESLQEVPLGEASAAAAPVEAPTEERPAGVPWSAILPSLLAVGVAAFAATRIHIAPPTRPDPAVFNFGTVPPSSRPITSSFDKSTGQDAFEKGQRLLLEKNAAAALPLLAEAVSSDPENALFRNVYGSALWATGSRDRALDEYRRAVRLAPSKASYRMDLAKGLAVSDQTADAISEYEALLALQPGDDEALLDLARLRAKTGAASEALALLRRVAELRPGDLVVQQDLAYALEKSGDLAGAAEVYGRIVDKLPDAQVARGRLAEMLFKGGKPDEALGVFRAGLEADPQNPLLHRGLASLLERTGHVREAIAEYREYARLAPNSQDAAHLAGRAARLEKTLAGPES